MKIQKDDASVFALAFLVEQGFSMVSFSVPLYARSLGATQALVGAISSGFGLTYIISALFSYFLLKSLSAIRKKLLVLLCAYAFVVLFYLTIKTPAYLFFVRALEGFVLGLLFPLTDTLPALYGEKRKSRLLSSYNTGWSVAYLTSPPLASLVIVVFGFSWVFVLACALVVLSALFVLSFKTIEQKDPIVKVEKRSYTPIVFPAISSTFVVGVLLSLYPVYLVIHGFSYTLVGFLLSLYALSRTVTFLFSHRIVSVLSVNAFGALGCVALFAVVIPYFELSVLSQLVMMALMGFGVGALFYAGLSNALPEGGVARTNVFEVALGAGLFLGPAVGGAVSVREPKLIYLLSAVLPALYLLYLAIRRKGG